MLIDKAFKDGIERHQAYQSKYFDSLAQQTTRMKRIEESLSYLTKHTPTVVSLYSC